MTTNEGSNSQPSYQVTKGKQTILGLYVTLQEVYDMWKTDPKRINILDVRTPEEYVFVGHPEMARNIPIVFLKHSGTLTTTSSLWSSTPILYLM